MIVWTGFLTALEKFKVCPISGYMTFMVWAVDFLPFFQLVNDLRDFDLLEFQAYLAKIQNLTQQAVDMMRKI